MKPKPTDIKNLLQKNFPEKTETAYMIMIRGYEVIKKELLLKIKNSKSPAEIITIIEEFK